MVYDVCFKESLEGARTWYKMLLEHINPDDIVLALVGNKCDNHEDQQVSLKQAHEMKKELNA